MLFDPLCLWSMCQSPNKDTTAIDTVQNQAVSSALVFLPRSILCNTNRRNYDDSPRSQHRPKVPPIATFRRNASKSGLQRCRLKDHRCYSAMRDAKPCCRRFGKNGFNDHRTRPDSRLGITQRRLLVASSLLDVRAALRGWSVNPAIRLGRIVRNELNGDG